MVSVNHTNKVPPAPKAEPVTPPVGKGVAGGIINGTGHAAYSVTKGVFNTAYGITAWGGRVVKHVALLTINSVSTAAAKNALNSTYLMGAVTAGITMISVYEANSRGVGVQHFAVPLIFCGLTGVTMVMADSAFRVSRWSANKLNINQPQQPLKTVL